MKKIATQYYTIRLKERVRSQYVVIGHGHYKFFKGFASFGLIVKIFSSIP